MMDFIRNNADMQKFNLTNIKPYARIGIALAILVIILFVGLVINSLKKAREVEPAPQYTQPSVPPLTGAKLPQPVGFEAELAKIKTLLPYTGPNYTIKYNQTLNIISVELRAENRSEFVDTRQKVEEFIKSEGVGDLCVLNIFWETPENSLLYKDLQSKDILTTDCPISPKRGP